MNAPQCSLKEVTTKITKGTTPTTLGFQFTASGIPFVRVNNLIGGHVAFKQNILYIDTLTDEKLARSRILPNDVLLSMAGTIGRASIVSNNAPSMNCNQAVCIIRCTSELDVRYLKHWLETADAQRQMSGSKVTGVISNLSLTQIRNLNIPLPPLSEQKWIAAILDKADALREKRRQAIAKLDELLQSVFLDMFGDPVTNPKGWKVVKFGDVTTSRLGKMLDKKKQTGEYTKPYLANYNVKWNRFELDELREMDFTPADQVEFKLKIGDLLVCEGGEVGRCAIWEEQLQDCYFQKALHRIRCQKGKCTPEYLLYYMWFMASGGGYKNFVTSATIPHLTGIKLKGLNLPLPPFDMLAKFSKIVLAVKEKRHKTVDSQEKLDTLFASLQQRAFKGEL